MANYIGNQPLQGEFKKLDSIASQFNGSSTSFALKFNTVNQSAGDASQLIVSLNGVIQEPLTAYTLTTGGSYIQFVTAPASGDTCHIVMLGGVGATTTPTDNSVTTDKIASGAITSAKIADNTITADDVDSSDTFTFGGVDVKGSQPAITLTETDNSDTYTTINQNFGYLTIDNDAGGTDAAHGIIFKMDGSESMRITSSGNVGIGTTTITADGLQIYSGTQPDLFMGNSADADGFRIIYNSTDTIIGTYTSSELRLVTNSGERVRIDGSGNVGIGTNNPDQRLHIRRASGSDTAGQGHVVFDVADDAGPAFALRIGSTGNDGDFSIDRRYGGSWYEALSVDRATGNIGIGTSNPDKKLTISYPGADSGIHILNSSGNRMVALGAYSANQGVIRLFDSDETETVRIAAEPTAGVYTYFRGGRVGIGTNTPAAELEVQLGGEGEYLRVGGDNAANGRALRFTSSSNVSNGALHTLNASSGNGAIAFATGSVERMRIDQSGNILHQGSSPEYHFGTTNASHYNWRIAVQEAQDKGFEIASGTQSAGSGALSDTYTNRFVILGDTGHVGIGTNTPTGSSRLHLTDGDVQIALEGTGGSNKGYINFDGTSLQLSTNRDLKTGSFQNSSKSNATMMMRGLDGGSEFRFYTASSNNTTATHRATIDKNGNLLVGTTAVNAAVSNDLGHSIKAGGLAEHSNDDVVVRMNRKSSDGSLIEFRRDGVATGVIGVKTNNIYLDGKSPKAGLRVGGSSIVPRDNGDDNDGGVDLGQSSYRWRSIYLSDGVYVGGTGGANKLDDYEEGTFTPTVYSTNSTSPTYTYQEASYTKIGRQVFCGGIIGISNSSSLAGTITIGGLPFTPLSNTYGQTMGSVSDGTGWTFPLGNGFYDLHLQQNGTNRRFILVGVGTNAAAITYTTTGVASSWYFRFNLSYPSQ